MARNIVEVIIKGVDKASGAFKSASKGGKELEGNLGKLVAQLGLTALAAAALKKALDFTKESTLLAARVETLGVVTEVMGKNAGKSAAEVRQLEAGIQSMGITTQASRQALAQMMRANIDLAKSTDLARLAQDAAVISGENSSQAFEQLTLIIGTGNTLMARRMGLLVDFEGAYKKLAAQLGKSTNDLTQLEKVQARTNEVMDQGVNIAGAYDAAMDTAGKKLSSYARHSEELMLAFGENFQDIFGAAIDAVTETTDVFTDLLKVNNMLTDAVKKGNITRAEAIKLKLKIIGSDKTAADVLEVLIEKEKGYVAVKYLLKEAIKQAKDAGVEWRDVVRDLRYESIDLEEATILLNERLEEQDEAVERSNEGMRQYAEWMAGATVETIELAEATEELEDKQRSIGDAIEGNRGAWNEAAVLAYAHELALSKAADAAVVAADAMTTYFDVFSEGASEAEIADRITSILTDHLIALAVEAALAGEETTGIMEAIREIDPAAAGAIEGSIALAGAMDSLTKAAQESGNFGIFVEAYDVLMETTSGKKGFTAADAMKAGAEGIDAMGLSAKDHKEAMETYTTLLAEGVAPVTAMAEVLAQMGIDGPPAIEEMGKLITKLEDTEPPASTLLGLLRDMTVNPWDVYVNVNYNDPGPPSGGGGPPGPQDPSDPIIIDPPTGGGGDVLPPGMEEYQHGSGGWRRVPGGYPNDSFRVGLSSGEKFNVVPAGGNGGGGMTANITINSNQDPQEIANEVIRELQFRMN